MWIKSANGDLLKWPWVERFVSCLFDQGDDVAVSRETERESDRALACQISLMK